MKGSLPIVALLFSGLISINVTAAPVHAEESHLTPEVRDTVNRIIGQAINGVTVFTSQRTVSSGSFTIRNSEDPDSHFDVYRIPVRVSLEEMGIFTPFVEGNFGLFHVVETFAPVEGEGADDFSAIDSLSAGAGGGVKIRVNDNFAITPALLVTYSHTRNRFDYNNAFSQEVFEPLGKELFNWNVDTLTYSPSIRGDLTVPLGAPKLLLWTKYTYLYNDSIATNSPTIDISSDTGLWQNSAAVRLPTGANIAEAPLDIRAAVTRTDIYRDGRKGLEFGNFYEISLDLIALVDSTLNPLRELSLGGSYTFGDDLSGWRVGVGYDF